MTLRDLLLRAYPQPWRREFGPELAAILATQTVTPALLADVLSSAAWQHIRRDPWKPCALGLVLWTAGLMIGAFHGVIRAPAFLWLYFTGQLFVFAAGAATALGRNGGIWRATGAAAKVSILPAIANMIAVGVQMHRYAALPLHQQALLYWMWKNLSVTFAISLFFGFAGALFGRAVRHFRKPSQASAN